MNEDKMMSPKVARQLLKQILEPYEAGDKLYKKALKKIRHARQISSSLVLVDMDKNRAAHMEMNWLMVDAAYHLRGIK